MFFKRNEPVNLWFRRSLLTSTPNCDYELEMISEGVETEEAPFECLIEAHQKADRTLSAAPHAARAAVRMARLRYEPRAT